MIGPFLRVFGSLAQMRSCLRFASNLAVRERTMVQVLSARLRKLRPAEECGGTSEVVLCYGLFVVSWSQIPKKRTKLFGWICGRSTERTTILPSQQIWSKKVWKLWNCFKKHTK